MLRQIPTSRLLGGPFPAPFNNRQPKFFCFDLDKGKIVVRDIRIVRTVVRDVAPAHKALAQRPWKLPGSYQAVREQPVAWSM